MPSSATLLPCAGLEAGRPDVDNFSTLDFFDPRGRANRKGLAVFAAVLIGAQAGVYGTMLATSFDPMSGPAWVFHFLFCWLGFVAIAKRLHDIGYGSRRLILAAIAMAVWTTSNEVSNSPRQASVLCGKYRCSIGLNFEQYGG